MRKKNLNCVAVLILVLFAASSSSAQSGGNTDNIGTPKFTTESSISTRSSSPHVEVELPGGNRLLFDTEQTIQAYEKVLQRAIARGSR